MDGRGVDRVVRVRAGLAASPDRSCGSPLVGAPSDGWTRSSDDLRQHVDLVVRGRDRLHATADQIRLGRILGRETSATFAHHPLLRRPDGRKLSKADWDTSVRELRTAGRTATELIGERPARLLG